MTWLRDQRAKTFQKRYSMRPFSQDRFIALDNDDIISKNEHYLMVGYALLTTSHLGKLHKTSEMKYKFCMQKYKVKSKATLIYAPVHFLFFSNWVWAISCLLHTFILYKLYFQLFDSADCNKVVDFLNLIDSKLLFST